MTPFPRRASRSISLGLLIPGLLLLVVTVAGCTRIKAPQGWSGGTISGDTLYIGTAEGELRALDRNTGQTKWKFELQTQKAERGTSRKTESGIYGTPAVAGDTVYLGGYDGRLYALSSEGEEKWDEPVGGQVVGGPAIADGMALVGSSDGTMRAFDIAEGSEVWKFATGGKVWSSPAVSDEVVYFGSLDHQVYAVRLEDGSKVWKFPTRGAVVATPLVDKGRVYVGSFDGYFYAIDARSGTQLWRSAKARNWFWAGAIASGNMVYAPSLDGNLYALNRDTGELEWTLLTEGPIVGSPVIINDLIAVASGDGKLRLVRLKDGSLVDECNVEQQIWTSLVAQGNFIYFGVRDHTIRALNVTSREKLDEKWVHQTNKDDPLRRDKPSAC